MKRKFDHDRKEFWKAVGISKGDMHKTEIIYKNFLKKMTGMIESQVSTGKLQLQGSKVVEMVYYTIKELDPFEISLFIYLMNKHQSVMMQEAMKGFAGGFGG